MGITCERRRAGHRRGRHGQPAGQRADRRRLVRAGRHRCTALGRGPGGPGRGAARRGPGLQRRRRHQGDAGHRGLRRPDRRQPGLLRRLRRGLRLRGAGDRRGATASASAAASAWSATPTSSSPATTPPSACPRSTAARSARPPTWPGWCRSTRCGRWSTPAATATAAELHALRLGAARSCRATSCATPRCEVAGRDRGEVARR